MLAQQSILPLGSAQGLCLGSTTQHGWATAVYLVLPAGHWVQGHLLQAPAWM